MAYYGVFIPIEKKNALVDLQQEPLVFHDKIEALKMLKKCREARLKVFQTYDEADFFQRCGTEINQNTGDVAIIANNLQSPPNGNRNCDKNGADKKVVSGEKSSFRCPTSQELVKFRKLIEQGDIESAQKTIWSNPRYLVSSGDTPTILKESFRYNALHVASIARNPEMCSLILQTVGDPKFVELLHGKDDTAVEVSRILLDLYLNMPERGRGETALHFAAKFGVTNVVEVLTSYKECLMSPNSEGAMPRDIICARNEKAGGDVVQSIRTLLNGRFYVPVMRSADNSAPAVIGEPFSETEPPTQVKNDDLLSPQMEVRAIAGPMNKEQAETFRKRWKTPPRNSPLMVTSPRMLGSPGAYMKSPPAECRSPIQGSPLSSYPSVYIRQQYTPSKLNDTFEKPSRRLFQSDTEFNEAPQIIKQPTELASAKKSLFHNYRDHFDDTLDHSMMNNDVPNVNDSSYSSVIVSPGFRERNLKCTDADKGLEVIGRCLAKDQKVNWREFWPFLEKLVDISSNEGLGYFEAYLQKRLVDKIKSTPLKSLPLNINNLAISTPVSNICEKLTKLQFARENGIDIQPTSPPPPPSPNAFHAYHCVEKSFQLFANRLLKPIAQSPNNIVMINDSLVAELSRLRSLVCSYKDDIRFFAVDFSGTHARFAHIVVAVLRDMEEDDPGAIDLVHETLGRILVAKEKINLTPCKNGANAENIKNTTQLICLIRQLVKRLNDRNGLIAPETLTNESECAEIWQNEEKCDCEWSNSSGVKVNRNIRRKMENLLRLHDGPINGNIVVNGVNGTHTNGSDSEDVDESFMSVTNSDDEDSSDDVFVTAPQSPIPDMFDDSDCRIDFENFIYGLEPTKMDNDVLKALHNVEIDRNAFPNVFNWYNALMKFTLEERSSFPQPVFGRNLNSPMKPASLHGRTPLKDLLPKINAFTLKPSKLTY